MPAQNSVFYSFCLAVQRYVSFSSKVLLVLLTLLAGCSSLVSIMTGVFSCNYISAPPSASNCDQLLTEGITYVVI